MYEAKAGKMWKEMKNKNLTGKLLKVLQTFFIFYNKIWIENKKEIRIPRTENIKENKRKIKIEYEGM